MSTSQAELARSTKKAIAAYRKKVTASPKAARAALVKLGTHTKTGRLTKAYK